MVDVRTLNFNEWCETPEVWIPNEIWMQNNHGFKISDLAGLECFAGLDLVSGLSLNAFVLFFPYFKGDKHAVLPLFWMPRDAMRSTNAKMDFESWSDEGLIAICEGNVIDNDWAYARIMDFASKYNINSISFNITLQNHDVVQSLVRSGFKCNPISQGYRSQSTPTMLFEELLRSESIEHFNNPILNWMNMNSQIAKSKDGDVRVQKMQGFTSGIIASVQAIAQWKTVSAKESPDQVLDAW